MKYSIIKNNNNTKWKYPKQPKLGETKIKIRFAWFPTKIDNSNGVWLERYIEHYEYKEIKNWYWKNCNLVYEDGSEIKTKDRYHLGDERKYEISQEWLLIKKEHYNKPESQIREGKCISNMKEPSNKPKPNIKPAPQSKYK